MENRLKKRQISAKITVNFSIFVSNFSEMTYTWTLRSILAEKQCHYANT